VQDITETLCGTSFSKSLVSSLVGKLDAELSAWRTRRRIARGTAAPQLTLTFYFDSHSYILRGISVLPPQGPGSADVVTQNFVLARRSTVPLSAVPPLTFMFQPPRVSV
jgi:Transposase, Mutator family